MTKIDCLSILFLSCLVSAQINFPESQQSGRARKILDYKDTISTKAGRHLLLITLLESLNEPVSVPRLRGSITYLLPPSLTDASATSLLPSIPNREPGRQSCCQLEDVPASTSGILSRQPGGNLLLSDLLGECDRRGVLGIKRGMHLRLFNNTEKQLPVNLAEIILASDSFSHLLSMTAAVRDHVNQELFREALAIIIIRRQDVGMVLPMSPEFLPASFESNVRQTMQDQTPQTEESLININWNEPPYQTYDQSEPEYNLWYFREDPEANSQHLYWHILFNNASLDRRGEFFFYMHRQMIVRYRVERLTQGLTPIQPLSPDTWDKPLSLGYFPKLSAETGTAYQGRPDNLVMEDLVDGNARTPLSLLATWYQQIEEAIKDGKVSTTNGSSISLQANQGRDEGISVLGDLIESLNSVNQQLYGSLHNLGHVFIARVTDPRGRHLADTGVMNSPATSMRDPVFYRWHQFIDDIFSDYKASLPQYTENELNFPGVKILGSQVVTDKKKNELHTLTDQGEVLLPGLDFFSNTTLRVRYNRLNHQPFQYKILVSSKYRVKAKVRIFLIPKETPQNSAPLAIEMDKFLVTLKRGNNLLRRNSKQTPVTGKRQRSLLELQEALSSGNITERELGQFEGCGWPAHLLLPRGTNNGASFTMFVMVSKLLPGDAALSADAEAVAQSSFVHCGLPGSLVPDSRPMGFPFDRPVKWSWYGRSNMAATNVKILHLDN